MSDENPDPRDVFGEKPAEAPRLPHREKLAELKRELAMRRNVYPKLVESRKITQATADKQMAALEAIVAEYDIQPWPQTLNLVREWRPKAEVLTVLGVRAPRMHRDELLAVLAFAVGVMRKGGILEEPKPPAPPPDGET